jgi:hypothetical protein
MDWTKEPPKPSELKSGSWDSAPPSDADKMLWESAKPELRAGAGQAQAGLEHFGNGIALGYMPQLQAGAESLADMVGDAHMDAMDLVGLGKYTSTDHQLKKDGFKLPESSYVQKRDENIARMAEQKKENPWTSNIATGAGTVVGGLAMAPVLPGVTAATRLGRVGQAAMTGAGMGVAMNPGDTAGELSPLQLQDRAKNGLIGAAAGGGTQAAVEAATTAIPWAAKSIGEKLKAMAEMKMVKSLNGSKAQMAKLQAVEGAESRLGRNLLDNKVAGPFTSRETMAERLEELTNRRTGDLTGELEKVSNAQAGMSPEKQLAYEYSKFSPTEAADKLKTELREQYSHIPEDILAPQLEAVDKWFSKPGRMDIKDVQAFKTQMQKFIKDGSYLRDNPSVGQEALMGIRSKLRQGIETNADTAAELMGEQGGKIKSINQDLGGLYQGADMLEDAIARGSKNQTISLGDKVAATAGAAAQGPWGLATGLANKVVREKGNQMGAVAMDKTAKMLLKTPAFASLAQRSPKAFNALVANFADKGASEFSRVAGDAKPDFITKPMDDEKAKSSFLEGN